ncbi:FAD-dependent oxidoreductase [Vibrio sp. PP-XX7]
MSKPRVAIIGGGVAGATAAVHLGELGVNVFLIERSSGLVNGPPICHLHAGGNLYREISQEQCLELLRQSIETVRLYRHTLNKRPTILAIPTNDPGEPEAMLPRLEVIKQSYQELVQADPQNQVLGDPAHYYQQYSRADLERLSQLEQPEHPQVTDDWMIPFAKYADLQRLKFPVVAVQEYGWSVFRLAAMATLTLERLPNCTLLTSSTLTDSVFKEEQWFLKYTDQAGQQREITVDYLVNACGYETGKLDDLTGNQCERMVEFKAAYVTRWSDTRCVWPEVIFHGQRGTSQGMAQLTPYADGVFQFTRDDPGYYVIPGGLVQTDGDSAQPQLPDHLQEKLDRGWSELKVQERSVRAISYIGQFIPAYDGAQVYGQPLYGAQQIPGHDKTLWAADVTFGHHNYARIEIVSGPSALEAARKIVMYWGLTGQELRGPFLLSSNIRSVCR